MIEVSLILFSLISEGFVILLLILLLVLFLGVKGKKRDKKSAIQLFGQIKKQSQIRLQTTGSFLNEKYRFEGDELKKAVKSIDQAEKKFIQKFINIYLKRDSKGLTSMDASVAEMIDTYKSLSPVMPEVDTSVTQEELEALRESNAKLNEEIAESRETMSNMISEFGSMFGGGQDHEMGKHEVVGKVNENTIETPVLSNPSQESGAGKIEDGIKTKVSTEEGSSTDQAEKEGPVTKVTTDEGIDDLLNSFDLSDDEQK